MWPVLVEAVDSEGEGTPTGEELNMSHTAADLWIVFRHLDIVAYNSSNGVKK
jgi:hypothetical protein